MLPFIIFSLPRTGSTTLLRLVNCHPGVRCIFEPFNPTNQAQFAVRADTLRRTHGLAVTVQQLWTICNGIKHVWSWDGFPFKEEPDLNRQMLTGMGARIVFLTRRNALRRAISAQISAQMQLWTPNTAAEFQRIREHAFGPLDIPSLREDVEKSLAADAWARDQLLLSGVPWREWAYEEFFDPSKAADPRIEKVQGVLEFLEVGRVADAELAEMRRLLDPANTGFQNEASYPKIPNIQEVERELGSATQGFVFGA